MTVDLADPDLTAELATAALQSHEGALVFADHLDERGRARDAAWVRRWTEGGPLTLTLHPHGVNLGPFPASSLSYRAGVGCMVLAGRPFPVRARIEAKDAEGQPVSFLRLWPQADPPWHLTARFPSRDCWILGEAPEEMQRLLLPAALAEHENRQWMSGVPRVRVTFSDMREALQEASPWVAEVALTPQSKATTHVEIRRHPGAPDLRHLIALVLADQRPVGVELVGRDHEVVVDGVRVAWSWLPTVGGV